MTMTDKFLMLTEDIKGELIIDEKKAKKLSIADLEAIFTASQRRMDIYEQVAEDSRDEQEIGDCAFQYKHFQKLFLWAEQELEYRLNELSYLDEDDMPE